MGDMLRFDAERLKILIERHHLYTGSRRARAILDDWDNARARFVKVMPKDYRKALLDQKGAAPAAKIVAAE
jgi:glutamate synthase (NADPH/NADH) large chain